MNRSRLLLLSFLLALTAIASQCGGSVVTEVPPEDSSEIDLPSEAPTDTPSPVPPTLTVAPSATPAPSATSTFTPSPTPSPDLTQAALADCLTAIIAFTECVNADVVSIIYPDGAPNHQIVNNGDPTTLYRSPDILDMLNAPGVTMVHNYHTRPDTCPLGTACVLHLLMIEFPSQEAALAFFERVTQSGMEGETVFAAPNAEDSDASKCATGMRESSAAGAPPFAVVYCSISFGVLHWGFNLSSYETLPEGFIDGDLSVIMTLVHEYLSVWR